MELTPWIAFTVGLFSALHCVGMCGPIIGALAFGLPPEVQARPGTRLAWLLAYNLGRISSYALAGALAGTFGALAAGPGQGRGHLVLLVLGAAILAGMGLYLGGWWPRFALLERLGVPVWRRLEPLARAVLPVRSPGGALLAGAVWGWLPCGLVYSTLLWAVTAGAPGTAAAAMAAFGLGTVPAVLAAGSAAHGLRRMAARPWARRLAGAVLIVAALGSLVFAFGAGPDGHAPGVLQPHRP